MERMNMKNMKTLKKIFKLERTLKENCLSSFNKIDYLNTEDLLEILLYLKEINDKEMLTFIPKLRLYLIYMYNNLHELVQKKYKQKNYREQTNMNRITIDRFIYENESFFSYYLCI
jgi:hypothetical protein